jgi:hypothetical protein
MFEHLLLHAKQLVLKSGGYMGTGTDRQQDDAVSKFTRMFVLHFHMQLLKHLTVTSALTVTGSEVQQHVFLNVTQCSQHHSLAHACDMNFVS